MLEVFFDNEKTFSFLLEILERGEEFVNCFKILYRLGIDPESGADILHSFIFLDILEETDDTDKGVFKLNLMSPVLLKLCLFDEFIIKYCDDKLDNKRELYNNASLGNFVNFLEEDEFPYKDVFSQLNNKKRFL